MEDYEWSALVQDVAAQFDDVTIKRGFQYYKQGRVERLNQPAPREIEALVMGSRGYRVAVRLDDIADGDCSCPVGRPCKHMMAAILAYADREQRSVPALVNAKAQARYPRQQTEGLPAAAPSEALAKLAEAAQGIADKTVQEWHRWMDDCLAPLERQVRNTRYVEDGLAAIYRFKPPLPAPLELLFGLHARLTLLEKLAKESAASSQAYLQSSFIGYNTHVAIESLERAIAGRFDEPLPMADDSAQWPLIVETADYLRSGMLVKSNLQSVHANAYYRLWASWIRPLVRGAEPYADELRQLALAEEELGERLLRPAWLVARSWMHVWMDDDDAALTTLREAHDTGRWPPQEAMPFLDAIGSAEDDGRLAGWLIAIGPMLSGYRRDLLERYAAYWDQVVASLPEFEPQMWASYAELLPYSASLYEEKLLAFGKWQDWIDYQLSRGSEPLDYRVSVLQPIEKAAPELLLPFYHQAVERYVLLKNRTSYKAAVKLLKRLAKLYAKLKREARWEGFMESFTSRHSRLRALTEEMRKGKLIP